MKLLLTVQYIPDRDSRVMDEVEFRIPGTGFRIPKPWIPDSKGKKCWILDSLTWSDSFLPSFLPSLLDQTHLLRLWLRFLTVLFMISYIVIYLITKQSSFQP